MMIIEIFSGLRKTTEEEIYEEQDVSMRSEYLGPMKPFIVRID